MKARGYFVTALAGTVACLLMLCALVIAKDPFFVFHSVGEDETALFQNQRYEMGGLIRNQHYSAVVMGTSLAANYHASWFTEGLGEKTLKITFPDGWIREFDRALRLAYRTGHELNAVCFSLDPNILVRPDSKRTVELPEYLYDGNRLNDVEYLLNIDTYRLIGRSMLESAAKPRTLDEAYIWDGEYAFSREWAIAGYSRPDISDTVLPDDTYLQAANENLEIICGWIEAHPETDFKIWFPPYSILYWDKSTRNGSVGALLTAVENAGKRLVAYENVTLYNFLTDYEIILDLNNYTDHIHCSGKVTHYVADAVMADTVGISAETLEKELAELREFVVNYDYTSIFP